MNIFKQNKRIKRLKRISELRKRKQVKTNLENYYKLQDKIKKLENDKVILHLKDKDKTVQDFKDMFADRLKKRLKNKRRNKQRKKIRLLKREGVAHLFQTTI